MRRQLPVHFAEANLPQLEVEMALGQGEFLEAFALSLGCSSTVLPEFYQFSRAHYSEFMGETSGTPAQKVQTIRNALKNNARLKTTCPGMILG